MAQIKAATQYARRGWSVIPVPFRSKNPGFKGWEQTRRVEPDLPRHFNGKPQNIGVLLGDPSGWLVDVNLDHPRCVEPAVFGRPSKPRSHRFYNVTSPVATRRLKSRSAGTLAELRSIGARRACLIDIGIEVGRTLAAIFGGYIRREFGNDAVHVFRPSKGAA